MSVVLARKEWTTASLSDCGTLLTGGTPSRSESRFWGGAFPWISAKSLKHFDVFESDDALTDAGAAVGALVPAGTVLFVVRGMSLAKEFRVGITQRSVAFNQDLRALVPHDGVDGRYLARFLQAEQERILSLVDEASHGTKRLTSARFEGIEVSLPPLPEQRRIADVLDRAEAMRAKRRAALALLDTLTQSIFLDMFGDLGTNPKRLVIAPLASLCRRITDGTHQPPHWSPTGHPFLFVSNIISGELSFETQKFISDDTHAELTRRTPIEVGDVLYSTVGSYGVPALVRTSRKFAFQRHIAHLKPRSELLAPEFLCAMLASKRLRQQADRAARGVAQKTVNLTDIRNFTVFCPPLDAQYDFAARVAEVDKLRAAHRASLASLDALFASLQHRAFRGEL